MSLNAKTVWAECLTSFHQEVSSHAFQTWFKPLKPISLDEADGRLQLSLEIPNNFYREWLEQHYRDLLRATIDDTVGRPTDLSFCLGAAVAEADLIEAPAASPTYAPQEPAHSNRSVTGHPPHRPLTRSSTSGPQVNSLNEHYSFDGFIEGECNRLARSAAMAIAERPGETSFNPFLVYGGVGLGKTHLVHAIGNQATSRATAQRVWYVSSERFTSEFVQAIQGHRIAQFTDFYRQMDILIVDDVQFFGGKEKTQEEFFHIFNTLHQSGKQVVLCADRPPREISGIEERLLSRFQWGLCAEVRTPDLETRLSILRHKAQLKGVLVPDEVIEFVGQRVSSNIRELEGALNRLVAHAQLQRRRVDVAFARDALKDVIADSPFQIDSDDIERCVCDFYQLPLQMLSARTRKREVVDARQLAMYFCKRFTNHTYERIGSFFGGRDHSTVIHACKTIEDRMEVDPAFREDVHSLEQRLSERL